MKAGTSEENGECSVWHGFAGWNFSTKKPGRFAAAARFFVTVV